MNQHIVPFLPVFPLPLRLAAIAALTIGMVMLGTANQDLIGAIVATLEERMKLPGALDSAIATLFSAALGLLMIGVGEGGPGNAGTTPGTDGSMSSDTSEAMTLASLQEMLTSITHPLGNFTSILVGGFAYAGSGDVLQIQKCMAVCGEENKHKDSKSKAAEEAKEQAKAAASAQAVQEGNTDKKEEEKEEEKGSSEACPQAAAALLSIAAIGCGDELSRDLTMRTIDHILQYGNIQLKRTVPLAIGLLFISNAQQQPIDLLSK